MRTLTLSLALAATAAAQATVTNTNDSGAGSLRAALTAANAAPGAYTIAIAPGGTTGPIVLSIMLPALTRSNVTIQPQAGAGRLLIDARAATAASGSGLELLGSGIQLLVPLRVLVGQGHGVLVRGAGARIVDLEVTGNRGGIGLGVFANANDLVVGRLSVDTFNLGVLLQDCRRARIADDGASVAECHNCIAPGFEIANGSDHQIGAFACSNDLVGIRAANCPNLRLGRIGNPRSLVTGSGQRGIHLQQCTDAVLTNADVLGNGGHGLHVIGGANLRASELRVEGNVTGALVVEGGAIAPRIGPNVTTRGILGPQDLGLILRDAPRATVVDCRFGPDHVMGVRVEPQGTVPAADVTLCRCAIEGNRDLGLSLSTSTNTLVSLCRITGNRGPGIEAIGASLATGSQGVVITDSIVSGNAGDGLVALNARGIQVGPGNRCDDNSLAGVLISNCTDAVVTGNPTIDRNRSCGIWIQDCTDARIEGSQVRSNRGNGIWAVRCLRLQCGPDMAVRNTLGTGFFFEGSDDCRLFSSQVTGSTGNAVQVGASAGHPGFAAIVLHSCLLADNNGLGVLHSGGPPVLLQLCTVAGNLRGVDSGPSPLTVDSCIVWGNAIEDLPGTASAMTVRNTFQLNPPPSAPGNTSADPRFVAPAQRDWRLQATSPAIGYAHPAIGVTPGAVDAYAGPRVNGPLDAGAHEAGPRLAVPEARLTLASATMAHLGSGLAFEVQYLPSAVGMLSILCLQVGPPSASFPAFGAVIPIASTPALLLAAADAGSVNTFTVVPPGGLVQGAILWGGEIPASFVNVPVSLCAVALDGTPLVRAVSNVAVFTIL